MLHDLLDPETQMPRSNMFWFALAAVVAAQLVAFYMLCSHQVRRAEARSAEVEMAQVALADCLQYIPGSTIASCTARLGMGSPAAPAAGALVSDSAADLPPARVRLTGATPVSFNDR